MFQGQVEAEIGDLDFERFSIYRPAVLMCDRSERRAGEAFVRALLKPMAAMSSSFGNCPTTVLARAMLNNALHQSDKKVELFNNQDIFKLADNSYFQTSPHAQK